MATRQDQHQLSILKNSSIKAPVRPHSGLPSTLHERINDMKVWEDDFQDEEDQRKEEYVTAYQPVEHVYALSPRDPKIEQLAEDLDNMSDDQFFSRLQELKSEHQKTLRMCEKAYHDKMSEVSGQTPPHRGELSRPPLPPDAKRAWHSERPNRTTSSVFKMTDSSAAEESEDDEVYNSKHRSDGSLLERTSSLDRLSESMDRIKGMWKDFNIEQYAPPRYNTNRPASASGAYSIANKENSWTRENEDTWSPVITIPKPFKMTLREAKKQGKKTQAQEEIERQRLEERKAEEAELAKKFKANPAPAHIYLPIYDEIMEQQETKRRLNHNYREELLRSTEKPFKFYTREEAKKRQKQNEAYYEGSLRNKKDKHLFKAKPVPKVLSEDISDKMAEEEEYRKIRVRMRAEELLRESRLPPSMDSREKTKELNRIRKLAQDLRGLGFSSEPSFRPKITGDVPDFDEAHRKMQKKLTHKRAEKEATVVQPFNLRTSRILSNKGRIMEDMQQDEQRLPETRWPYKTSRSKPSNIGKLSSAVTSDDRIPCMTTQSTELRKSHTKKRLTEEMRRELSRLEAERKRRQQEKRLKNQVSEKAAANDIQYGLVDQSKEKLRRYREEERARAEEYRRSLREMQDRVSERPLLFESVSQKNARMKAERNYDATLSRAGVKQGRLNHQSSRSMSPRGQGHHSGDSDEDGSYVAPNRRSPAAFRASPTSIRSASREASPAHTYSKAGEDNSYADTFTKEETGLSEGDFSDADSIPDKVLEMA